MKEKHRNVKFSNDENFVLVLAVYYGCNIWGADIF